MDDRADVGGGVEVRSVRLAPGAGLRVERARPWRRWWRRHLPIPQAGHGRPRLPPVRPGPLAGRRVLIAVAPTECDGPGARALERVLGAEGAQVAVTAETLGEA